jgi:hypothetical protein
VSFEIIGKSVMPLIGKSYALLFQEASNIKVNSV